MKIDKVYTGLLDTFDECVNVWHHTLSRGGVPLTPSEIDEARDYIAALTFSLSPEARLKQAKWYLDHYQKMHDKVADECREVASR